MKMKRKTVTLCGMLAILVLVNCTNVFALTDQQKDYLTQNNNYKASWIGKYATTNPREGDGAVAFIVDTKDGESTQYYYVKGVKEEDFANRLDKAMDSARVTEKTVGITDGLGIDPDTQGATDTLSGFVPILNILIGIIVVLITLGMGLFTSFDICYIVFPVFRNKCEDAKTSGQGAMVQHTANGGTKLRWVSDEAQWAVSNCSLDQGKNPLTAYLSKRIMAYVCVSIVMFILLTGNITLITNIALKAVAGIMQVFSSLA